MFGSEWFIVRWRREILQSDDVKHRKNIARRQEASSPCNDSSKSLILWISAAKATVLTRFSQNLFQSCLQFSQGLQLNISVQRHQPSVRMTVEKAVKN